MRLNTSGVLISAFTLAAACGLAMGQGDAQPSTQASTQTQQPNATQPADVQAKPYAGPVVRVTNEPVKDQRDGRVNVGGIMISRPTFTAMAPNTAPDAAKVAEDVRSAPNVPTAPAQPSGLIEVPMNTIGPGLSLQQRNDMNAANRAIAQAQAQAAERVAAAPLASERNGAPAIYLNGLPYEGFGSFGRVFSPGYFGGGLYGPVTTTVEYSQNDAAGAAQRNFAAAAAAGTGTLGNLQQQSNERLYQTQTVPKQPTTPSAPEHTKK